MTESRSTIPTWAVGASTVAVIAAAVTYTIWNHYFGRLRQNNEPPLIRGKPKSGCIDYMNQDMSDFLHQCKNKHGSIFTLKLGNEYKTFIMNPQSLRTFMLSKHSDFVATSKISKKRFGLHLIVQHPNGIPHLSNQFQKHLKTTDNLRTISKDTYYVSKYILNEKLQCNNNNQFELENPDAFYKFVNKLMFEIDMSVFFGDCNKVTQTKRQSCLNEQLMNEFYPIFVEFSQMIPLRFASQNNEKLKASQHCEAAILQKMIEIVENTGINSKFCDLANDIVKGIESNDNKCTKQDLITTRSRLFLLITWATHGNITNKLFWFIFCIMIEKENNSDIFKQIKTEINNLNVFDFHSTNNNPKNIDFAKIGILLPTLKAYLNEIYRFYNASNIYRKVTKDFHIKNENTNKMYKIRKGDWIAGNAFFLHRDCNTFGNNAMQFDATRFLSENGQKSIKNLVVFGTMCPGKFIATNMLLIVMAFIIQNNFTFKINNIDEKLLNPNEFEGNIPLSGSWIRK